MAACSSSVFVAAVLVAGLEPGLAQHKGGMHMQFDPLLDDIMDLDDLIDSLSPRGGMAAPPGPRRPSSTHSKEDQLDRDIDAMLDSMLSDIDKPAPQKLRAGMPLPGAKKGHGLDMPLDVFDDLFPGPLIFDNDPMSMDILGSGPDPIIMEMLGETHSGFKDTMVPIAHNAAKDASMNSPRICHPDVLKHCGKSHSQLHCLGAHQADISKVCRDSVSKSVPFVCSANIDKFCDTLHGGILPCLELHMDSLEINCKDSVKATRAVITTANTHKVTMASPQTGAVTASVTPSPQVLADALKAELDRKAAGSASSGSVWEAARHVLFFLSTSAVVYVLYTTLTIHVPEMMGSWKLVRVFGGLGGKSRETQRLFADTEMPKPVDSFKL